MCGFIAAYNWDVMWIDSVVLFPLRQGGLVLLMWAVGALFYREKVRRTGWLMLAFGLVGMVLLSI